MNERVTSNYKKPILLYDGFCNLCGWTVRWVRRVDKKNKIQLIPLQDYSKISPTQFPFNTVVFIDIKGTNYFKSDATLRILKILGGGWLIPWFLIIIFPPFVRDWVYGIIARNRYKWFGKSAVCHYPDSTLKEFGQ